MMIEDCPVCGAHAGDDGPAFRYFAHDVVEVECSNCGCRRGTGCSPETATDIWNTMCKKAKTIKSEDSDRTCLYCGHELILKSGEDLSKNMSFAELTCSNCDFKVTPVYSRNVVDAIRGVTSKFNSFEWNTEPDLHPCPICHSTDIWCDPSFDSFRYSCLKCGCSQIFPASTHERAVQHWNEFCEEAEKHR